MVALLAACAAPCAWAGGFGAANDDADAAFDVATSVPTTSTASGDTSSSATPHGPTAAVLPQPAFGHAVEATAGTAQAHAKASANAQPKPHRSSWQSLLPGSIQ